MLASVGIGLGVFVIYALGACRTIYAGDSGELVTAVHVLGIPHPTGYPLYVLLGKLWTLLVPVGSIAFRMSLFSAAAGGLACGLLHAVCRARGLHPVACVLGALALAFAPSFWGEATIQRVYTLNAVFVVAALGLSLAWYDGRRPRTLATALLVCGLGATNHTFMAVFGLALLVFAIAVDPALRRRPWRLAAPLAAFAVGLLPYVYLPLRSRADPALDWGNPETLRAFLDVVLRRSFWGRAWLEQPADLVPIGLDWARSFAHELGWGGLALAALGVAVAWRRRWPLGLLALVLAGNLGALALHGSRSDIFIWHRYYVPTYAVLALLAAAGTDALVVRLPRALRLAPLGLPAIMLATGWAQADRSRYAIAEAFSSALLDALPPGAHLAATDDNVLFVLMYLHFVEGRRPDVDLILQGVDGDLPALRFDPEQERLFFTHDPNWHVPELEVVPAGLVFEARRRGSGAPGLPPGADRAARRGRSPRPQGLPHPQPPRAAPLHARHRPRAARLAGGAGRVRGGGAHRAGQRRPVLQPGAHLPAKRPPGGRATCVRALRGDRPPARIFQMTTPGGDAGRQSAIRDEGSRACPRASRLHSVQDSEIAAGSRTMLVLEAAPPTIPAG